MLSAKLDSSLGIGWTEVLGFYAFQGQSTLSPMDKAQVEGFKVSWLAIKAQKR
jgi:hypothetical protein